MKRLLVLSTLCLALAGCAQSKGALSRGASYPPSPVAITPVPSVYDTINAGMGGKAVAQTANINPDDPQWAGRAQATVAARPVPPAPPGGPAVQPAVAATSPVPGGTGLVGAGSQPPTEQPMAAPAAFAAASAPAALSPLVQQASNAAATSPVMARPPASISPGQGPAAPGQSLLPADQTPGAPDLPPLSASQTVSSGRSASGGAGSPPGVSSQPASPTAAPPTDIDISPSSSFTPVPVAAAPGPNPAAPNRGGDPLLGPDPDLMPAMPATPPVRSNSKAAQPASGPVPLEVAPAADSPLPGPVPNPSPAPSPSAEPGATGTPIPLDLPIELEKSGAASKPANPGLAAADLPLEAAPPSSLALPAAAAPPAVRAGQTGDPRVILTSSQEAEASPKKRIYPQKNSGSPAARVGDEIITFRDVGAAVSELKKRYSVPQSDVFDSAQEMQIRQLNATLVAQALDGLIDQSLLVQEAKRHIKDKQMLEKAYEQADKIYYDNEIIPLMRQYKVDTEGQLKEKLAEDGKSLDGMRLAFRRYFLAHGYMHEKLKDRLNVELPDLLKYYNDHVYQHEFDRPAQITWRELVVEVDKHKSREEAQKKADSLLEKVRRGADFAQLARSESEGPTSSRNQGGLMQTTPGSYAVKPINDALDSLPVGQVSGVLEGPDSFHILKVENRRAAGPASFAEIYDQIKPKLADKKYQEEREAFLKKIKREALVYKYIGKDAADAAKR
jgi:parvulin-like peptidyl-prolyl isomerase